MTPLLKAYGSRRKVDRDRAMYAIGHRISTLRTARGLSLTQLAKMLERRQPEVTHWEYGHRLPGLVDLWALCELFGVSLDILAGPPRPEEEHHIKRMEVRGMPDRRTNDPTPRRTKHRDPY